jgi:hypothetical protein
VDGGNPGWRLPGELMLGGDGGNALKDRQLLKTNQPFDFLMYLPIKLQLHVQDHLRYFPPTFIQLQMFGCVVDEVGRWRAGHDM